MTTNAPTLAQMALLQMMRRLVKRKVFSNTTGWVSADSMRNLRELMKRHAQQLQRGDLPHVAASTVDPLDAAASWVDGPEEPVVARSKRKNDGDGDGDGDGDRDARRDDGDEGEGERERDDGEEEEEEDDDNYGDDGEHERAHPATSAQPPSTLPGSASFVAPVLQPLPDGMLDVAASIEATMESPDLFGGIFN
jgi:hypothetical protein